MEETTGERPPELDGPPIPPGAEYLWGWFLELHRRRGSGGFGGAARITWEAIDAWARRKRTDPEPWELDLIEALDDAFMAHEAKAAKNRAKDTEQ